MINRHTAFTLGCFLAVSAGCLHDPQAPPVPGCDMAIYENGWEVLEAQYPLFEYKELNWTEMARQYYDQAFQCSTEEELSQVLVAMMGEIEDPALFLHTQDGDTLFSFTRDYESNVDMGVLVNNYLQPRGYEGTVQGFGYCNPEAFPYAYFEYLPNQGSDTLATRAYDDFIEQCVALELPAIILDIRMNPSSGSGGITGYDRFVLSRLVTRARVSAVYRIRCGLEYGMLTDYHPWIQPGGDYQYDGTVYLLTGGECNHAAEDMAVNLSHFDNIILLGDTTAGDVTITAHKFLDAEHHWWVRYGFVTVLTHDYEWVQNAGIPPDVYVEAAEADFASGVDPVLEYVIMQIGY